MAFNEAKEQFAKMLRWTEQPKDQEQAEKTIFLGSVLQGYYVGKRTGVGQNGSTVYEILLPNGEKVAFWGSGLLDGKFDIIPVNCMVRVSYLGIAQPKTPKGRAYQNFKVEFDKDAIKPANLIEVSSTGAAPAAPTTQAPVSVSSAYPQGGTTGAPSNQGW